MDDVIKITVENWPAITGMLVVNIGLIVSITGAVKIYRADSPRNDWILQTTMELANKPRYAVFAPNDYNPQSEKQEALENANKLIAEIDKFNNINKKGMKLIFLGFIIQFIGNMLWGWFYLFM